MKKLYISALACGILFSANAQNTDTTDLQEVVVTTTRAQNEFKKAARKVTIITKDDLEKAAVSSVNEALEMVAGVDVRQRGPQDVQSDVSIRGGSFEQTLILINGMKLTDPQTGHHNMDLPVSIDDIERIEVLHGGASRIYGPNAFAGAINIITKTPETTQITANAAYGQYNTYNAGVSAQIAKENNNHLISANTKASDGYIDNTDFDISNLYYQGQFDIKEAKLSLNAGYTTKKFGAQNYYTASFPNQYEETKTLFTSVKFETSVKEWNLAAQGYFRQHNDRFDLYRNTPGYYQWTEGNNFLVWNNDTAASWYPGSNYHKTHVIGAELSADKNWKLGNTAFGFDYRKEMLLSNNLGEPMDEKIVIDANIPNAFYSKSDQRDNYNVYIEHTYSTEKLNISAGALYNYNSAFGSHWYPGIDASYQVSKTFRPFASFNHSVRFPSFTDLYYNLGGAVGSKNLKPESSYNYELGTKVYLGNVYGEFSVFNRQSNNLIDWITPNGSDSTFASNITEADFTGIDAQVIWQNPFKSKIVSKITIGYNYLTCDTVSNGFSSAYVLDFLQHNLTAGVQLRLTKHFSFGYNMQYADRLGGFYNAALQQEVAYGSYLLHHIKLDYRKDAIGAYVSVNNLGDTQYFDIGNVVQPGIWVMGGVKYTFKFK